MSPEPDYAEQWYASGTGYGYALEMDGDRVVVHLVNEDGASILTTRTFSVSDPDLDFHTKSLESLILRGHGHRIQRFYEDKRSN